MLTRLITLSAVILSVTNGQQVNLDELPKDGLADFPERAKERVDQFYGEGVDLSEMIKDVSVFFNMYKSRYTNILPVNFRHMILSNITELIDELVEPYVDIVVFEDKQYKSINWNELKDNIKLIFAGRMWFSNMAYFNEQKRYMKLNQGYYNDDITADMLASLAFNLTGISLQSPNNKISASNWDIVDDFQKLKHELSEEIWLEFEELSNMLIQESERCVYDFFHKVKRKDLLKEIEIIADTSMGKHGEQTWEDNFRPFSHTDSPKEQTQKYAYSISYEFPKSCGAGVSRNRAVHPDFENDPKDKVFLQWIETAFDRRHVNVYDVNEEGFEYLKHQLFEDTQNSYWLNYFKNDFENTLERKIERNEYEYLDAMSYDTIGNSWVDKEGREYDLDLEDTELDHTWQQNQLLKDCLKYSIDSWENVDEFFANQEHYDECLRMAPDIIYFDDDLLIKEQQAFQQQQEKYEAFHKQYHDNTDNSYSYEDMSGGRRLLRAKATPSQSFRKIWNINANSTATQNYVQKHESFRKQRASLAHKGKRISLDTNERASMKNFGAKKSDQHPRYSRKRNDQTVIETIKDKVSDLLK